MFHSYNCLSRSRHPKPWKPSGMKRYRCQLLFFLLLAQLLTIRFIYKSWKLNRDREEEDERLSKINHHAPNDPTEACPIPQLVPYPPALLHLLEKNSSKYLGTCETKDPLLFESRLEPILYPVKDEEFFREQGYDSCCYRTVERGKEEDNPEQTKPEGLIISPECFPISFTTPTEIPEGHEFIAIYCTGNGTNGQEKKVDAHAFVHVKKPKNDPINNLSKDKLNLIIFGLDSVSRMSMMRTMPKTYAYLKEVMGAVEMTGYNKMGANTFPNLMPMLTSKTQNELNYTQVPNFDEFPFIWKDYSNSGFYTSLSEDATHISIFNYIKPGFKAPPVDYYLRPISYWSDENIYGTGCFGPHLTIQFLLNYMQKFMHVMTLAQRYFFQLTWATDITHRDLNSPRILDDPVKKSLESLKGSGYLNDTIFILMSDHGNQLDAYRGSIQGQLEDRLPFMFLLMPDSFKEKYSRAYQNLLGNKDKLFATFDIHETLKDILNLDRIQPDSLRIREAYLNSLGKNLPRGLSLFLPLPHFRTCKMAGIAEQYCSCSLLKTVDVTKPEVENVANVGVAHINSQIAPAQDKCATLQLSKVTIAQSTTAGGDSYMINFETKPGGGQFEALINRNGSAWEVQGKIDRTNLYGNQSHCVEEAKLKPYCYCLDLINK